MLLGDDRLIAVTQKHPGPGDGKMVAFVRSDATGQKRADPEGPAWKLSWIYRALTTAEVAILIVLVVLCRRSALKYPIGVECVTTVVTIGWFIVIAIKRDSDDMRLWPVGVNRLRQLVVGAVATQDTTVRRVVFNFIAPWPRVNVVFPCFGVSIVCHRRSLVRGKRTPC